ncbi:MAG: hypothetical protein KAS16_01885 [Thermoplasmata archaeon]|nr:hypothetical protein [Thermoplasmata archaeon]
MRKRTELLALTAILFFSILIMLLPVFYHQPYETVTSVDYWSHAIRMQQFDAEGYINFETDWTNLQRIDGESKFYPPGFPLLLFSMKELGDIGYYLPSLISLMFAPFFCLLLYLTSRKLLGSGPGLIAAFMGACFISGSNMLGPTLPLASTLAVLMMLLAFLVLLVLPDHTTKVVLAALFFGAIFITHRASLGALILMFPFIAIAPLLFTKNRKRFLEFFHYPLMMSVFLGIAISMIFWANLPIQDTMTLGGILPTGLDELSGFNITKSSFLGLVILFTVSIISFFSLPIMGKKFFRLYEPIMKKNIPPIKFLFFVSLLPIFLIFLIIWFIFSNGFSIPISPGSFVSLWGSLSTMAHNDYTSLIIKQILYVWHWNILPLLLLIPSIYLYFKSNRNNLFLSLSIGILLTILFAFVVQDALFDVKVQRIYFYISPFVFFIAAWGGYHLLTDKRFNKQLKKVIVLSFGASMILIVYSSLFVNPPIPPDKIGGMSWTNEMISPNDVVASSGYATQEARGLGQMNYVIYGGLFTIDNNRQLIDYLTNLDVKYILIPPEMQHMNRKILGIDNVYLIYSNEGTNVYTIDQ